MTAIPLPTESAPGRTPAEGGGRLINAYADKLSDGASAQASIRRAPGLRDSFEIGYNNLRGAIYVAPYIYAAFEGAMVRIDAGGSVTIISNFAGSDPVFFSRNNKRPIPDIVAVTRNGAFIVTDSGVADLADPDLPAPVSGTSVDGYFFFAIADGRMFASGLNATTVSGLDFATAESNPDGLIRAVGFGSRLYACGASSIEVWANSGNAVGFPFSRATSIPRGIIGADAVTGWEDGFSKQLVFVGDDCQVYTLAGYQAAKISTAYVDWSIQNDPNKSGILCWNYTLGGHPCVVVDGTSYSWVYDLQTGKWHERKSYLSNRWRAARSVFMNGRWIVGDRSSTKMLEITDSVYSEATEPLEWIVESAQGSAFPNPLRVNRVDFDFSGGVGITDGIDPNQTNPQFWISWSDDGGYMWSTPVLGSLGRQVNYGIRATRSRCGLTGPKGRRWRVACSDPVYVSLLSGDMSVEKRAA